VRRRGRRVRVETIASVLHLLAEDELRTPSCLITCGVNDMGLCIAI